MRTIKANTNGSEKHAIPNVVDTDRSVSGAILERFFFDWKTQMDFDEKMRRYRLQARMLALVAEQHMNSLEDWQRASGNCVCQTCGLEYYDHPTIGVALTITCDGRLWHL